MNRSTTWLAVALAIACATTCFAVPVQWAIPSGGNGHYYDTVRPSQQINWDNAEAAATSTFFEGNIGNLATVTSPAENAFLVAQFGDQLRGVWLGGIQPPGSVEPAGGWEWITGEPWVYTNWQAGEPNNSGGNENRLAFATAGGFAPGIWNDFNNSMPIFGYVVEFVPEPSSYALASIGGLALIGLAQRRRSRLPSVGY